MPTYGKLSFAGSFLTISLAAVLAACGSTDFKGSTQTRQQIPDKKGGENAAKQEDPDFVQVGVSYELESGAGLSLVDNALSAYKVDLIGGDDCWGSQATPFTGNPAAPSLKVRKAAVGCVMVFNELTFKDPSPVVLKTTTPLRSDDAATRLVEYASTDDSLQLTINVAVKLSTAADSVVKLTGRIAKVITNQTTTASEELSVSAQGDVVAYPNVNIVGSPLMFRNAIRVTLNCGTAATAASACVPAILPQSGTAGAQAFSRMDAAVGVLKGAAATGFPGSLSQASLDSLFAAGNKINNVAQGLSNIAAPVIKATTVEFKDMIVPAVAAADKTILVVRYYEMVGANKVYTYKVFRIGL